VPATAMEHSPGFLALVADAKTRVRETTPEEVHRRQQAGSRFHFVDVREDGEWEKGHARGAVHLSKGIIERDIEKTVPDRDAEIILYCGGGFRSALAAATASRYSAGRANRQLPISTAAGPVPNRSWIAIPPPGRTTRYASASAAPGSETPERLSTNQTWVKRAGRNGSAAAAAGTSWTWRCILLRRPSSVPAAASSAVSVAPTTSQPERAASHRARPPSPAPTSRTSSYFRKMPRALSASSRWKPVPLAGSRPRYGRPRGGGVDAVRPRTRSRRRAAGITARR